MKRRGLVLAYLMRFKQTLQPPAAVLGDGRYGAEDDSGKFARLPEIAEEIASRQEKVLVFTQFREMTEPLAAFLGSVFGRPGWCCTAARRSRRRKAIVDQFQARRGAPFFVLSLKAGGNGLEPDRRLARHPFRSLVEPGGREPGDRPGVPHRPDQQRPGAQVRLPRHHRGTDRPADRRETPTVGGPAGRRRRETAHRDERRRSCSKLVALDLNTALKET